MSMSVSSYKFVTSGGLRRFVHRWHLKNNEVIECNKCGTTTTCKQTDAYGVHWPKPKTMADELSSGSSDTIPPSVASSSRTCLIGSKQVMANNNIESFMLCDTKTVSDTQQFLLDAGMKAIPDLLSTMYATAAASAAPNDAWHSVAVAVRFYVGIKDDMFQLQATEMVIKHHYDIRESVDMIFAMLLEKLRTFMTRQQQQKQQQHQQVEYSIKRLFVKVRKQQQRQQNPQNAYLTLPMQFQRKQQAEQAKDQCTTTPLIRKTKHQDLISLTSSFKQHLLNATPPFQPPFPCNVYSFQVCANSLELHVVPYHLSSCPQDILTTRSFIILCNVEGYFKELQEITNIKRFLHHSLEDRILTCRHCQVSFNEANKLMIHMELKCGQGFHMSKMDPDFIEIYENCLMIEKCESYTLYGLLE